jgi:hypothetical protein
MTPDPTGSNIKDPTDGVVIDDVIEALRAERRRGPSDFIVLLGVAIAVGASALFAVAVWLGPGVGQDVLLNLSTELVGALVTVVLIGGLWRQMQVTALGDMDVLTQAVEARRAGRLSDEERVAFERIVEVHRRTIDAPPVIRQAMATWFAIRHRHELRAIEVMLRQPRTS